MYTVMLIDDEPWVLARIRSIVDWERYGFHLIYESNSPEIAWKQINVLRPDVVFTDINMPNFSGLELINTARSNGIDSEFVIISGYDNFSYAQEAIANGVFYYFLKPVNAQEFESVLLRLRAHLDKKGDRLRKPDDMPDGVSATGSHCLNSILLFLHTNYQQPLSLADISKNFYVSQTYICDLFSKYLDKTFIQYLNDIRLKAACSYLTDSDYPVSRIALEAGFHDYSYFSRVFRKKYRLSPTEFRQNKRKNFFGESRPDSG